MKLRYTPEAHRDLQNIKQYIAVELCNSSAAISVSHQIIFACQRLKEHPYMGIKLSDKTGRETDLRYIIIGNYLAFYRIDGNYISIVRILDSRTNYMYTLHL